MTRPPKDNVSDFLSRVAPYIYSDGGRNLNEIARDLELPYSTVQFRMKRLEKQGIRVAPIVDVERLGLERVRVFFELSNDVKDYSAFFQALHQAAGLRYYARSLISQIFDCEFDVPRWKSGELSKLLKALEEMKFVQNITLRKLVWKDFLTMRTEYFDYLSEEWDVDFSKLLGDPSISVPSTAEPAKVDYSDLILIKSIQVKPFVKLVEMAKQLGASPENASYHLNKHVLEKKLISSFKLKWAGTKNTWAKHRLMPLTVVFNKLVDDLTRHSMSVIASVPFTWNHMRAEDGTYIAELLIPISHLTETMQYVSNGLRPLHLKPEMLLADSSCLYSYTIPYQLYDIQKGWKFSAEESLGFLVKMISAHK